MKQLSGILCLILVPFIIGKSVHFGENNSGTEISSEPAYPEHIAGAFTGGFGEQSCHSCHFDYDLNHPDGELAVAGIGSTYSPGKSHTITVRVQREDMAMAGFQMTARFEDGSQAGRFELTDELTTTPGTSEDIIYVQHGIGKVDAANAEKEWNITWIAPEQAGAVIFNVAANAANGDASAFGDWIYVEEIRADSEP